MKRSEAIAILSDILYEASGHVAEEINPEWLLDNIEKRLNMLPPPLRTDAVTSTIVYCYYTNIEETHSMGLDTLDRNNSQLWEPEDE